VVWLKYHEHLQAHRHDHDSQPHHLAYVRRFRRRKRPASPAREIRK
jgi:hypothetical protein